MNLKEFFFSVFFYEQCLGFAGKSSIVIRFIKSFGAKVQNETSLSSSTSMGTSAVPPSFCLKLFSLKSWCMYCPSSQSHFFISFSQCSLFSSWNKMNYSKKKGSRSFPLHLISYLYSRKNINEYKNILRRLNVFLLAGWPQNLISSFMITLKYKSVKQ